MKKIITVVLVLVMILSLASCGGGQSAPGNSSAAPDNTNAAQNSAANSNEAQNSGSDPGKQDPGDQQEEKGDSIQADKVLIDNEFFKLTFKGIENPDPLFYNVKLKFESKNTGNISFTDRASKLAVNDIKLVDPNSFIHLDGNDKDIDLCLFKSDLEAIGLDSVDKIEKISFSIGAYPNKQSLTHYDCEIYPTGLDNTYVSKARAAMPGDVSVGETPQVRISAFWREGSDFVNCFKDMGLHRPVMIIENPYSTTVYYAWEDFTVNGVEIPNYYTGYSVSLDPGETAIVPMLMSIIDKSELESRGITKAEEISFMFMVRYGDGTAANTTENWYKCIMESSDLHN